MLFQKAKSYAFDCLETHLPGHLYYHGVHHTRDVYQAVEEIANEENIGGDDLLILLTAAVYHDMGFSKQYLNNEPIACLIATSQLPSFNYTPSQIEHTCRIIMATRVPQKPTSHLEEIMCDADLDYLGRDDFFEISSTLKMEWKNVGLIKTEQEWMEKQVVFLENHHYFTNSVSCRREKRKQLNLNELRRQAAAL